MSDHEHGEEDDDSTYDPREFPGDHASVSEAAAVLEVRD